MRPSVSRRQAARGARSALAWGLFWLVLGQVAFRAILHARPGLADPEFGRKLADLEARIAEHPGRPLVLMFGSSRVATGFRPEVLSSRRTAGEAGPLVFNFAQVGSGPEMAHLSLCRLLDRGIRPDLVLVEFWPPTWSVERDLREFVNQVNLGCLDRRDVALLAGYVARPRRLERAWLATQWLPLFANRRALLDRLLPSWFERPGPVDPRCRDLDPLGWWCPTASISPQERIGLIDRYRKTYEPRLQRFHVAATPDRALRAILSLCDRERIRAAVVVLPEGDSFRRLYPPSALREVQHYLARIGEDYHVPVVDARLWVVDDGFIDGHHLLPDGASRFTRRLGEELLHPWLAGAPFPVRR